MSPSAIPNLKVERELFDTGAGLVLACDEVGRGAIAGPVTVGLVLIDPSVRRMPAGLRDSKLLVEPKRDVFRHGKIVEQREMLEHHADAARAGLRRPGEDHLFTLPEHFAFARLDQSINGFDERRFARAVFAEQRMNLPRPNIDIDRLIGQEIAIALGQANRLEQRPVARMLRGRRRI